jgi:hypothetical protein
VHCGTRLSAQKRSGADVDEYDGGPARFEIGFQNAPDSAEATDDDLVAELFDRLLHSSAPKQPLELSFGDQLKEATQKM